MRVGNFRTIFKWLAAGFSELDLACEENRDLLYSNLFHLPHFVDMPRD